MTISADRLAQINVTVQKVRSLPANANSSTGSTASTACTILCVSSVSSVCAAGLAELSEKNDKIANAIADLHEAGVEALGQDEYAKRIAEYNGTVVQLKE